MEDSRPIFPCRRFSCNENALYCKMRNPNWKKKIGRSNQQHTAFAPSRWARPPGGHALPVGTPSPSRCACPPGARALPVAADEQAQPSHLVCIFTDRTALALRVLCVSAGRVAVPGLPVATARAPGAEGGPLCDAGLPALCAGAGRVAVPGLPVATARAPGAVGGALCVAGLPALCAGAGRVAVPGLPVATARAPGAVGVPWCAPVPKPCVD